MEQGLKYLRFWCQKVLPLVYDDSLSYYELLCKVVEYINNLIAQDNEIIDEINNLYTKLAEQKAEYLGKFAEQRAEYLAKFAEQREEYMRMFGEQEADYLARIEALRLSTTDRMNTMQAQIDAIQLWIDNYSTEFAEEIIKQYIATMIFVEINMDGYIVYYIPEHWDDITFNTTGLDISIADTEYGRLVLSY